MKRRPNTNRSGSAWTTDQIKAVWAKGEIVQGYSPDMVRRDACGALIEKSRHGVSSHRGWHIDHHKPVSKGGDDDLSNLQPLQWQNNLRKSNDYPRWHCAVTS